MSHLSLPLGSSYKERAVWDALVEWMERRLTGLKLLHLCKGGRLI